MAQKRKPIGCLGWLGRVLLGLVSLFILLGMVGAIYQARATAADRARFRPPGEFVQVDNRNMHIYCQGEGSPTVILDAGTGGWSIAWSEIMPELAQETKVCSYDRAGLGWSEAANDARTPQDIASDLKTLLEAADTEPPYIITGFSYTGLSARVFSFQNPDEVVGMVLVDPTTEFDNEMMDDNLMRQQQSLVGIYQFFGLGARLGLVRFLEPEEMAPYAPFIPEDVTQPDIYYSFVSEPVWWQTSQKEFSSRLNVDNLDDTRVNGVIRDIPTVIIGAETVSGEDDKTFAALQDMNLNHLREIASRSELAEFVLAEGSSHEVPRDKPEVVIDAIKRVIEATR